MSVEKGGGSDSRTHAEIDKEAIEKYNKNLQVSLEREARLHQHFQWRGNKLPPFNIEPFPRERERLAGAGMTAEDRAARKQWLHDQELAPHEPVYIAELYPKNPLRRLLGAPWNGVFGALKPVIGEKYARLGRAWVPKYVIAFGAFYATYYYFKYCQNEWVDKRGWHVHYVKPKLVPSGKEVPPMLTDDDFYDRGFKHRSALRS